MGYTCDGGCDTAGGYLGVTLVANDSYGDGWNGNLANVYFDGVLYDPAGVGFTYTLVDGDTETSEFCVDQTGLAGCLTIEVGGGSWQSEVSWDLFDSATGGAVFALNGGAPYSYSSDNCPTPGCTDATACNFMEDADEDDGSCVYPPEGEECPCINDDSTVDSYGDTCTSWYDTWASYGDYGCTGGYDTADFNAAEQCCACQPVYGCTDATACNFDEGADLDDASCFYAEANFDCDGNCIVCLLYTSPSPRD